MAKMHATVALAQGHKISAVLATKKSSKLDYFVKNFHVPQIYTNIKLFLEDIMNKKCDIDAIVVCVPWNVTEIIIDDILSTQLAVLVEKPVSLSERSLKQLLKNSNSKNMLVGYNRKYYDYMPEVVNLLKNDSPYFVEVLSAEPFDSIVKENGKKIIPYLPHFYTSHILNILVYTLGTLLPLESYKLKEQSGQSTFALLSSVKDNVPVSLKIFMNSPQNSYIKYFFTNNVILLSPLEKMIIYDRIDQIFLEGKRMYIPNEQTKIDTCTDYKAGIFKQMQHFIGSYVHKNEPQFQTQEELICVTQICDWISNNS